MSVIPFGPFRPDVSDYESANNANVLNVVPRGDGYGPFPDLSTFTSALTSTCRGMFNARKADGSVSIFAGTSNKLWNLDNTGNTWTDVSRGTSTYGSLATTANWEFEQFNNYVIATQASDKVQYFDLTASSTFGDLSSTAPQAAYVSVVNRFLMLSGLPTPDVYRVQWSAFDNIFGWVAGESQSDFQDLADGGIVRGVAGGENGVIFQDSAIRRITYQPGSPVIFGIERIASDDGLLAPYSLVNAGDRAFWLSPQGFKMLIPGGYPTPIGKEKLDRTFFADVDLANLQLVIGASDPSHTRIFWGYKSSTNSTQTFDVILVYDWILDLWTKSEIDGEYLASLSRPGLTLEGVNSAYGTNIDTISLGSFDDIPVTSGSFAAIAAIDASHQGAFFTGPNLEAILETGEHGGDGKRIFVRGYRPVTDAPTVFGSVSARENLQSASGYSTETQLNSIGKINSRVSTRYARGKIRIPAATSWTFAMGAEPDVVIEGEK